MVLGGPCVAAASPQPSPPLCPPSSCTSASGSISPSSRGRSKSPSRRSVLGSVVEVDGDDDNDSDRPPSPRRMGTYSKDLVERAMARQERRATAVGTALQLVGGGAAWVGG
jgi:hypothetical protein